MKSDLLSIPVPGKPLCRQFGVDSTPNVAKSGGFFLAGPENHLVEAAVGWALGGGPVSPLDEGTDHTLPGEAVLYVPHCPILFYGPPGSGKSHLASGIFQNWRERNRRKRGDCLTGNEFAQMLANAIETKSVNEFRDKMRKSEMLVIDNIDLLAGKKAAQDELLVTMDAILDAGQTVVLTAQRFPTLQLFSDERLISRLTSGLIVPLVLPGETTRAALLKRFAEQLGLRLTAPANRAMTKELPLSVPQLFGTLAQLFAESDKDTIDLATARVAIQNATKTTVPTVDKIAKVTAKLMGLKLADMKGKSRKSTTVRARAVAIYLARQLTQLSLKEIGKYFGGRDHTTVAHSANEIESKAAIDAELRGIVRQIRETLQQG